MRRHPIPTKVPAKPELESSGRLFADVVGDIDITKNTALRLAYYESLERQAEDRERRTRRRIRSV
jgi:hypothetical protein